MDDETSVMNASLAMADAISKRDVDTIATLLAPGFVHRSPGGDATDRERFIEGIRQIPGEIVFVTLESVQIDVAGQDFDDRRAFVDWFVRHDGCWKFRAAVDLPAPAATESPVEAVG